MQKICIKKKDYYTQRSNDYRWNILILDPMFNIFIGLVVQVILHS